MPGETQRLGQIFICSFVCIQRSSTSTNDFDFEIVNFPFLDGDVPCSTSYGVYISQLIRFARASSFVTDFSTHNKIGYNINVLQQTACLVVNPIPVGNFAFLFNCTPVGRISDSMTVPT